VLVVDVDGTLTAKNRRLDLKAVEALRAAEAAGVPVVLATGNVLPIVYALSYFIGTTGPVVAENGGIVCHRQQVDQAPRAAEVEAAARRVETTLGLERLFTDRWRVTEVAYPEGPTTFADVQRALSGAGFGGRVAVERTGFAIHLMAPDHSKFRGVERALAKMGASPDQAMAAGDSDNDISMLQGCRVGVALGDASPGLKAAADFVARRAAGAGLFEALRTFGVLGPTGGRASSAARTTRAPPARRQAGRQTRGQAPARRRSRTERAPRPPRRR
jgi:phosphoglycolate phosphatase